MNNTYNTNKSDEYDNELIEVVNNDTSDEHNNEFIKVVINKNKINEISIGENYCPIPKSVLKYIGEEDYFIVTLSDLHIDIMKEMKKDNNNDNNTNDYVNLKNELKYLDDIFINGNLDEIKKLIKTNLDIDDAKNISLIKEKIYKMINNLDDIKNNGKGLEEWQIEGLNEKFKMNDKMFKELLEWIENPTVKNGFDSRTPSYIMNLYRNSVHFIKLFNVFGYHKNFTTSHEKLLFYIVMHNTLYKMINGKRDRNNDAIYFELLEKFDNDVKKIEKYFKERTKKVMTNKKFIELLKEINQLKEELKTDYKYHTNESYNNTTKKQFMELCEANKKNHKLNYFNDKRLYRQLEIYLLKKGIDIDHNNAQRVINFFDKLNIVITRDTYEKLKTCMIENIEQYETSKQLINVFKVCDIKISDDNKCNAITKFLVHEFLNKKNKRESDHCDVDNKEIHDGYEETLNHFDIISVPSIMFDYDLIDIEALLGWGTLYYDSEKKIYIDKNNEYGILKEILKLKKLADETDSDESGKIMENIISKLRED